MGEYLSYWQWGLAALTLLIDLIAAIHAILTKRDTRAAIGWVGVIWLAPLLGPLLYWAFGINRITRRARRLRPPPARPRAETPSARDQTPLPREAEHLAPLVELVGGLTGRPLEPHNRIVPLHNGEEAYPEMVRAIRQADRSVALSTYLFDNDPWGRRFVDALGAAVARGVEVRVLIDDIGLRYSWPSILRPLRRAGVSAAAFLPQLLPWYFTYANLRNHRKILVTDGQFAFTGGMNIRAAHDATLKPRYPVRDIHFRVEGPVVSRLLEVFVEDWEFTTGEPLQGEAWRSDPPAVGTAVARCIPSGPDGDFEDLRLTYLGALACARQSVRIMTPYFLPDGGLVSALNVAALRGVEVDILLPRENNLRLVQWASTALLDQVLEHGCRVWRTPPPFDHTKLMLVDDVWVLLGSANWDDRSLRLNFELDLECYDPPLAAGLAAHVRQRIAESKPVTPEELTSRSLPVRLRDGIARLFSPYL